MKNPDSQPAIDQESARLFNNLVHDLNNLLMVVSCTSTALLSRLADDDPNRKSVSVILEAGIEAAELGRQLRQHSLALPAIVPVACEKQQESASGLTTILLVDDEPQLLDLVKKALQPKGYEILVARHGPAAIATALKYRGPIQLLITDMQMPDMNGDELAAALRRDRPDLSVLYISGHADESTNRPADGRLKDSFLQKPFAMVDLLRRVVDLVGSPQASPAS